MDLWDEQNNEILGADRWQGREKGIKPRPKLEVEDDHSMNVGGSNQLYWQSLGMDIHY